MTDSNTQLNIHDFPCLYSLTSTNAKRYWQIAVKTNDSGQVHIVTKYGQMGGKEVLNEKLITETKSKKTLFLQAVSEAESDWNTKKNKKGYVLSDNFNLTASTQQLMGTPTTLSPPMPVQPSGKIPLKYKSDLPTTISNTKITIKPKSSLTLISPVILFTIRTNQSEYDPFLTFKFLPMLANKFTERKSYVTYPCYSQIKLDGVRYTCRKRSQTEVVLRTRNDGECPFFFEIKAELAKLDLPPGVFLDGEFYSKKIPFRTLNGYCNRKKMTSKHSGYDQIPKDHLESIHYYIFDCYFYNQPDMPYSQRLTYLRTLLQPLTSSYLHLVDATIVNAESEIQTLHDQYVAEGHEGEMIRNANGRYRLKDRSNDLLKYKEFQDEEYQIVGAECPVNGKEGPEIEKGLPGCIIWQLKLADSDLTFTCRPRDTHDNRRQDMIKYLDNPNQFIGQMYTVRFQEKYNTGIPRFPVGVAIRYSD